MLRVRSWCCALHTFVRICCLMLICTHAIIALSVGLWNALMARAEQENARLFTIIGVLAVAFNSVGVICNVLVLVAITVNKRILMLPWLVFQAMLILGLFSVSLVLLVYFTLLVDEESRSSSDRAMAVVALFPLVGGIFLIFVWVLFDQLFIQMRAIKSMGLRSVSASNLARLRANLDSDPKVTRSESMNVSDQSRSNEKLKKTRSLEHMLAESTSSASSSNPMSDARLTLGPHVWVSSSSTPRRPSDVKRRQNRRNRQLLEQSETQSPNVGRFKSPRRDRRRRNQVNQVILVPTFSTATQEKQIPSYCTIDRSRLRRRALSTNLEDDDNNFSNISSTLPRKPPRRAAFDGAKVHKVRSVDNALNKDHYQSDNNNYFFHHHGYFDDNNGYLGNNMRRARSEHFCNEGMQRAKSVTIHPDVVTELRYRDCDSPSPPPFPSWEESASVSPSPPPPPADLWPPSPATTTTTTSESPLPFGNGLTRDEIIHFYCHQDGDVPL